MLYSESSYLLVRLRAQSTVLDVISDGLRTSVAVSSRTASLGCRPWGEKGGVHYE